MFDSKVTVQGSDIDRSFACAQMYIRDYYENRKGKTRSQNLVVYSYADGLQVVVYITGAGHVVARSTMTEAQPLIPEIVSGPDAADVDYSALPEGA